MIASILLLLVTPVPCQDPQGEGQATDSTQVEALRERIHGMRMNLLLGGDKVRKAETDATQFYKEKIELVEKRLDSVAAELTELRASYQLTLERALQGGSGDPRKSTLREAEEQRQKVQGLESEQAELTERRSRLERLVEAVEARGRERQRLATKIESEPGYDETQAFPLGDIGLAPELEVLGPGSPLDDQGLVGDLLARDPVAAHRLLYEADPRGYWSLFPLRPPLAPLREVLKFPEPDLPGQR